jgi:lauroyl/myristoyl acyltransferase
VPGVIALWVWVRIFGYLPLRVLYLVADIAGTVAWYLVPRLRRVTVGHMSHVYKSDVTPMLHTRAARGCVRSAARYWADLAWGAHRSPERTIERIEVVDGIEHFIAAHDRHCGVIFASAHLGNPELLIRAVGTLGFDILVLTEPLTPPSLHRLMHDVRAAPGVRFAPADRSGVRLAIEQLRNGGMLAIMADRDVLGSGLPVPFFDELAQLPRGAVELALRANADLIVGFVRRSSGGKVRVRIGPPLDLQRTSDREANVAHGMELLLSALEEGIRESPEQWFALHPVWNRPAS